MKKIIGLVMIIMVVCLMNTTEVQASEKTSVHFAHTLQTVQCIGGEAVDTECRLHIGCSEKGHYDLAKGNYKSSNKSVATIKNGNLHCTGKAGSTIISVKYKGKVYKTRIRVISTEIPYSMVNGAVANQKCFAASIVNAGWVRSTCLGKRK